MQILRTLEELKKYRAECEELNRSIGFVPTMGALHEGHASLLRAAKSKSHAVLLSIFINPTQFNQSSDFEKYPRTEKQDLELAKREGVAAVWLPSKDDLYPDGYRFQVLENELSKRFCGSFRPGHFEGVLTVVLKLLNLVKPKSIFLGEKDFQQLELVREMVSAFFLDIQVLGCPTIRETNGLAMSSRNSRLSSEGQIKAGAIYRIMNESKTLEVARSELVRQGFKLDYLEEFKDRWLVAAWLEGVRLIDNVVKQ